MVASYRALARIGAGQCQQLADDLTDPGGFALDRPEGACVPRGVPVLSCGELGARAQQGDRGAKLVRRVGHEAPHLGDGPLDRRGRLADEKVAGDGHEQQRHERRGGKGADERGVLILELEAVRHDCGDIGCAAFAQEPLGVESYDVVVRGLEVAVRPTGARRLPRCLGDPVIGLRRLDRAPARVEQIQRPIGDVQLVEGVGEEPPTARLLHLADVRGLDQRRRGGPDRCVELPGHLAADCDEQAGA